MPRIFIFGDFLQLFILSFLEFSIEVCYNDMILIIYRDFILYDRILHFLYSIEA